MVQQKKVDLEIKRIIEKIKSNQSEDGAFRYSFESGPMTDANFLILLRVLEDPDEALVNELVQRLLLTQQENGSWKLYEDSDGHLSSTIEAYTALLFSGYFERSNQRMKKAEHFILTNGGLNKAHSSTKFMLALNGLYPWPSLFPFPLFIIRLPNWFSFSFNKMSSYVRAHFSSVIILGHYRFKSKSGWAPDLSHLFIKKPKRRKGVVSKSLQFLSQRFSKKSLDKASSLTLSLQGEDGTVQNYASATFYFIYSLLALGYPNDSPSIKKAINGLRGLLTHTKKGWHLQNSPSTVWDTSLINYSLDSAGDHSIRSIQTKAIEFLINIKQGNTVSGGWPFSESESSQPDLDDTQAVLRSLAKHKTSAKEYNELYQSGLDWLLESQNKDGGFGSFEKDKTTSLFTWLPFQNLKDTLIDPSIPDLTGRILEFLGTYEKMSVEAPQIKKAVRWLIRNQEKDGSWYGRWGVSYIYGTWAALTGLTSVGISSDHSSVQKAKNWLESNQQQDGGWGESCRSDQKKTFISLNFSTLVQTAWAVDALTTISSSPTPAIERGIEYLLMKEMHKGKTINYPTGAGLPGHFYIYYHSYPDIWPLLTLSHYKTKYSS